MKYLKVLGIGLMSVAMVAMFSSCSGSGTNDSDEVTTVDLVKDEETKETTTKEIVTEGSTSGETANEATTDIASIDNTTAETTTKKETATTKKPQNNTTSSTTKKPTTSKPTTQSTTTKEETTTQQQTTAQPQKVTYTVSVKNKSGMSLGNITVYVYADNTHKELVEAGTTNSSGIASFTLKQSGKYSVVLGSVPVGYQVSNGYSFSGTNVNITLASSVIKGALPDSLGEGDIMYDITVIAPDGKTYTVSEILKKKDMVVLNFWFTNCSWCIKEFPYINDAYAQYKDKVEFLAINPYDTLTSIDYVKTTYGLTFPMTSCDYSIPSSFGVTGYPTSVVIDKNGVIRMVEAGARIDTEYWKWLFEQYID